MSHETVGIVEGWSARLDFSLKENDAVKDLSGLTMIAEALDRRKQPVTLTGDLTIISATDGRVRLTPDTGDFPPAGSPFELRFKAVQGGEVSYYPSDAAVKVEVRRWA
jgi:hypothetical protein